MGLGPRWSHLRWGGADRDGAVGLGNPWAVGLFSFIVEARLYPFQPLS